MHYGDHTPVKRRYFSERVRLAKEELQKQALQMARLYKKNIILAMRKGDHETASESMQWFMEHVRDEDGNTIIDQSVDKPVVSSGPSAPTINIGFKLGGIVEQKELPPATEIVDVIPETKPEDEPTNNN